MNKYRATVTILNSDGVVKGCRHYHKRLDDAVFCTTWYITTHSNQSSVVKSEIISKKELKVVCVWDNDKKEWKYE